MISSVAIQVQRDDTDTEYWELIVRTMDLETAKRLSIPIVEELDQDIEIMQLINEE